MGKERRVGITKKEIKVSDNTITTPIGIGIEGYQTRHIKSNEYMQYHPVARREVPSYQISYYRNFELNINKPIAIQDSKGIIHIPTYNDVYSRIREDAPMLIIEEVYSYNSIPIDVVSKINSLYLGRNRNGLKPNSSLSYERTRCITHANNGVHTWQVVILTTIHKSIIDRHKSIYVGDLGIQILDNIPTANNDIYHPLFNKGFVMENLRNKLNGNLFSLTIVDNKSPKNTIYYAKVGGVIYEVMAEQSSMLEDGIHFTAISSDSTYKQTEHIPLEDIEQYGVYRNKIDAENGDEYSSREVKRQLLSENQSIQKEIDKQLDILDKVKEQIANRKRELAEIDDEHRRSHQELLEELASELREKRIKKEETEVKYAEKIREIKAKFVETEANLKDKLASIEKQIKEKEEQLAITTNTEFYNRTLEELEKKTAKANSDLSNAIRATEQEGKIILPTVEDIEKLKNKLL